MDLIKQKQGMKGPVRPAPGVPKFNVNRYSPVTNWNDDPFGADVFEPTPQFHTQKKEPPPRPPPPKILNKQNETSKPSHFIRKPTVLSSLLSRKNKASANTQSTNVNTPSIVMDFYSEDTSRMFPKCDVKNIQTGALIDLSSPPSSPTFTTRSSSDGLSVDSFGSDATTSTNHHNAMNGGNASQAESGFEDDFDLFLNTRKFNKEDTLDDFSIPDPFSPPAASTKPPIMKKPILYEPVNNFPVTTLKGPTIIRAKPARPKPPDSTSILKSTFGNTLPLTTSMTVNTTTPIQKISNGFGDSLDSKQIFEVDWGNDSSPERESSPPMPSIPPPPPPPISEVEDLPPVSWPLVDAIEDLTLADDDEPYAIALFDYFTDHPDDLCFSANSRVKLIRRVDDEWLFGKLRNGAEGLFPSNYVEIKVPLPNEQPPPTPRLGLATALYDFAPDKQGDLPFNAGDTISVIHKINEEWFFGECNGIKGQFPSNYVQTNF